MAQLVDYQLFDLRLPLLDSNKHRSLFGAASLLAQTSALGAAFAGSLLRPRRLPWDLLWFSLAILLLLRVFVGFNLLQAAPFVLVVFVVVWKMAAHASRGGCHAAHRLGPANGLVPCARGRAGQ
jgi:hypothetical protein